MKQKSKPKPPSPTEWIILDSVCFLVMLGCVAAGVFAFFESQAAGTTDVRIVLRCVFCVVIGISGMITMVKDIRKKIREKRSQDGENGGSHDSPAGED